MQIVIPNELGFAILKLVPSGTTIEEAAAILLGDLVAEHNEQQRDKEANELLDQTTTKE